MPITKGLETAFLNAKFQLQNYAPTVQVQKEAAMKGLSHVLWLYGEDHQLTEVGIMNIMMVYINDNGGEWLN